MAALLVGRFEQDRPGLAAWSLSSSAPGTSSVDAALARQVQTLGHPGDLLMIFDAPTTPRAHWAVVLEAAHAQDMSVIALTGGIGSADDNLRSLLRDTDVQIRVLHSRPARIAEAQRLLAHCLCDAVDLQLLGAIE